ncbi:MAG: 4Fe-4S binding protein [Muribaculaceae bacterium]|nr:4Fe-4S binding protein [Muribaculaceae bacterium]
MYRSIRITRIIISLIAMAVPTVALVTGYDSVFVRMQILVALLSGVALVLLFWAIVTIVYGRIYCSTVCPMGTLMDCVSAGSRLLRRRGRSYVYTTPSTRTRIIFLVLAIVSLFSGASLVTTILDPYTAYSRMVTELVMCPLGLAEPPARFALAAMTLALSTALVVLVVAWRHGRLLCNTVCPVGTILGYGSRRSYFHIEIDPDKCINCGECERVCKAQCIKLPQKSVDTSRCVVCFDCAAACPNSAIQYKSGRFRLGMPMMQNLDVAAKAVKPEAPARTPSCCAATISKKTSRPESENGRG